MGGRIMEPVGACPDTALELVISVGGLVSQASALVAAVMAAGEPDARRPALDAEEWRAALSNVTDALMETAAALRNKEIPLGAFAAARRAGAAEGYERGLADGRREGQAGRRPRARHLSVAAG